ncbi:hypothetical protein, partial [Peribacillus deserti]|uniref:hypothetical protein n=1 Tax=Peribacillus deserti TaxID=673318 RepID=UPI001C60AE18
QLLDGSFLEKHRPPLFDQVRPRRRSRGGSPPAPRKASILERKSTSCSIATKFAKTAFNLIGRFAILLMILVDFFQFIV